MSHDNYRPGPAFSIEELPLRLADVCLVARLRWGPKFRNASRGHMNAGNRVTNPVG